GGDRAQHSLYVGAVGGVDDLGSRVRLPARNPGFAAAAHHGAAWKDPWRDHGRIVSRFAGACAGELRRYRAVAARYPAGAFADVPTCLRALLARRGDREPGSQLRGLW